MEPLRAAYPDCRGRYPSFFVPSRSIPLRMEAMGGGWPTRYWRERLLLSIVGAYERPLRSLDIGANIGIDTVYAAAHFDAVEAFEIDPETVGMLRRNIDLNGLDNVTIHPFGLSVVGGAATLYRAAGLPELSNLTGVDGDATGVRVEVKTLDDFAGQLTDTAFLHIDAEGLDLAILAGGRRFLDRLDRVPVIGLEFSPRMAELSGPAPIATLRRLIEAYDYRLYALLPDLLPVGLDALEAISRNWHKGGHVDIFLVPPPVYEILHRPRKG